MPEESRVPGKNCIIGDCIWVQNDNFCDVLTQAAIPLDEKWPLVILTLRSVKDARRLSETQKARLHEILLAVLRAKDYSQTRYEEVQESIYSALTLHIQEKLDQVLREISGLTKDMCNLFGKHQETVSVIAQDVETGLTDGSDPVFVLSEIRGALKDVVTKMQQDASNLVELAHKDSLTGLANRRHLEDFLDQCVERWKTRQESVSLIMCDIDHFKKFNDTYGHPIGDQVLRTLADQMRDIAAPFQDDAHGVLVARYGGEEFCVVLSGMKPSQVIRIAEQLRKTIEKSKLRLLDSSDNVLKKGLHVTISLGIADLWPQWEGSYQANLVDYADKALYHAKSSGRNRTARYTPDAAETYALVSEEDEPYR
jgi:diguanylate cyclase (GGDEF)-like protein